MVFYSGYCGVLFPVPSVEQTYARTQRIQESQHSSDRPVAELWVVQHEFSCEMQEETFAWLDDQLADGAQAATLLSRIPRAPSCCLGLCSVLD